MQLLEEQGPLPPPCSYCRLFPAAALLIGFQGPHGRRTHSRFDAAVKASCR